MQQRNEKRPLPELYACLGVDPSISVAELTRRYRRLSRDLHPDRVAYRTGASAAEEAETQRRYQCITEAYKTLSDPQLRAAYDARHSVNFYGRLANVMQSISQHNSDALTNKQKEEAVCEASGESCGAKRSRDDSPRDVAEARAVSTSTTPVHCLSDSAGADDDDDDEYSPDAVVSHERRSQEVPTESRSQRGGRGVFALAPRVATMVSSGTATSSGFPSQQWRCVTIRRMRTPLAAFGAVTSAESESTWGLVFAKNVLLRAERHPELPFPAVVTQVNERVVRAGEDIVRIIAQEEAAQDQRVSETKASLGVRTADGEHNEGEECSEAEAQKREEAYELTLTLTYGLREYDFIGNTALLASFSSGNHRDECVLDALLPSSQETSELRTVMPGVTVMAINGLAVTGSAETRQAFRAAADELHATGASRRGNGIVVTCVTLDGVEEALEE